MSGQFAVQHVKSFGNPNQSGATPNASLILGSDGFLYGTTSSAGGRNNGTVFKLNRDGTGYIVLHSFTGIDGRMPQVALLSASDGKLYGTTFAGGSNEFGIVFRLNRDGTDYSVLHNFAGTDGRYPQAGLLQASDGFLYGTTSAGGTNDVGTIFKLSTNGTGYRLLYCFAGTDGTSPYGRLIQGSDGLLYGTTYQGGLSNLGTIFKLGADGGGYTTMHNFAKEWLGYTVSGYNPKAGLVQGGDGKLYGTTVYGGGTRPDQFGTVFKINSDGTDFGVLGSFVSGGLPFGLYPEAELVLGYDGNLYGTTSQTGLTGFTGTVFRVTSNGISVAVLHHFSTTGHDGTFPTAGLVQDLNGVLYGTTSQGGVNGVGTVFKVNTNGSGYTVAHSFSASGNDAQSPVGGLVQASNGRLYGISSFGGSNGIGTIFALSPSGADYSVLHTFKEEEGINPLGGPAIGTNGAFYGTAAGGGTSGFGSVFKINADGGGFSVIHNFVGTDGKYPQTALTLGADGVFYGTAYSGGAYGLGTMFKINSDGGDFTLLRDFGADGANPAAPLIQGSDGTIYGTTQATDNGFYPGTVFKINSEGSAYTVLHLFGPTPFGVFPNGLVQGPTGTLYGTTISGAVYMINSDGSGYNVIHNVAGNDGLYPRSELVYGQDGAFYGTTSGLWYNPGTIYKVNPDGSGFSVLWTSSGYNAGPTGPLLLGMDGQFYGTTGGGDMGCGSVFRMVPGPRITSSHFLQGGVFQLSFESASNFVYRIDTSTNLVNWTTLTNFPAVSSQTQFSDTTSVDFHRRYYRISLPP